MKGMLETALSNPWDALRTVVDGPLHPGGRAATEELFARAGVTAGTSVVDIGCGAGESMAVARNRGARAIGVDRDPGGDGTVRGEMTALPVQDGSVDVVLAECVMCLAPNRQQALAEASRVLDTGGRLAVSDVIVEESLPAIPEPIERALCLQHSQDPASTISKIEAAGFDITDVRDHREELLAMRDQVATKLNYEAMLPLMGDRGATILEGIHDVERAVDEGNIDYISVVAERVV